MQEAELYALLTKGNYGKQRVTAVYRGEGVVGLKPLAVDYGN